MERRVPAVRLRHELVARNAAWIVAAVILASATAGCARWPGLWYGSLAHLKDNPFDQSIRSGQWSQLPKIARERLLKRFPAGSRVEDLRRYLEAIGSSCERAPKGPVVCQYSQFGFLARRGYIGDEWREYAYYDFTTRIWQVRGTTADVKICYSATIERQGGPMITGRHSYVRKSKFKPCV